MATRSRARHFHATAKALNAAAATRDNGGGMHLSAEVVDVDINAIVAGAAPLDAGADLQHLEIEVFDASRGVELPASAMTADEMQHLHEELRWAESKLMHASERLAEAQDARRKDLVALAIMRRELLASFAAERAWLQASMHYFGDIEPVLVAREAELAGLVDGGVRTDVVINELAAVRAERKLFTLAIAQSAALVARIDENELTSEFQVASEAYDAEPDGDSMREVARLRSRSTRARRDALQLRNEAGAMLEELDMISGMGEVTAIGAFLAGAYEGETRSAERVSRVRAAQVQRELSRLPEAEAAWKAGLKHPVHFMRARRTTR